MRNIFSSVNKYVERQSENFLTESLCYVVDLIVSREPKNGELLMRQITNREIDLDPAKLTIITQETTEVGRPDLVISQGKDFTFFIEIKHDSSLGHRQLERYFDKLETRESLQKQLILITRSKHSLKETRLDKKLFRHISWYELSSWLSQLKIEDQISKHAVHDFLLFLEEKEMSTQRVEWDYIRGVPALVHLSSMLDIALSEAFPDEEVRKSAGWKEFGFYFGKDKDGWLGIEYETHLHVHVAKAGPKGWYDEEYLTLDLEKSPFFTLQAGEQLELLVKFIKESIVSLKIKLDVE